MISFYCHIVAPKIIKKYLTAKYYKKKKARDLSIKSQAIYK